MTMALVVTLCPSTFATNKAAFVVFLTFPPSADLNGFGSFVVAKREATSGTT